MERDRRRAAPGRISDLELASRLSFFLWSSIPDDELHRRRVTQRLRHRRSSNGRSSGCWPIREPARSSTTSPAQWLFLRNVDAAAPDPRVFPDFDEALRRAMRRETELFLHDMLAKDRSVLDLLTADYTFVNERLARHYGIGGVYGNQFRRVSIADTPRRGLLGHGSLLTVTSYATAPRRSCAASGCSTTCSARRRPRRRRTSRRCRRPCKTGKALSMREAMEQHRANPSCASCHARMDPLGFALENFDAVGRWRTKAANAADRRVGRACPMAPHSRARAA